MPKVTLATLYPPLEDAHEQGVVLGTRFIREDLTIASLWRDVREAFDESRFLRREGKIARADRWLEIAIMTQNWLLGDRS